MLERIINSTKKFLVGSALALSLYGCGEEPAVPESSGCTSNEQCRDERVCSQGECVFPEDAVNNGVQEEALIAFSCYDEASDQSVLNTMLPDGSNRQELGSSWGGFLNPQWSPNKKYIAYDTQTMGAEFEVWVMDVEQKVEEKIPLPRSCITPNWYHDSKRLVASCPYLDQDAGFYTIDLESKETTLLLASESDLWKDPKYVPGENYLVFRTYENGNFLLLTNKDSDVTILKNLGGRGTVGSFEVDKNEKLLYSYFNFDENTTSLIELDIVSLASTTLYEQPAPPRIDDIGVDLGAQRYLMGFSDGSLQLLTTQDNSLKTIVTPCEGYGAIDL